jgi:hypothetical protein
MIDPELFFFDQLNEKQKRLYAGLKSLGLGYHGVSNVSQELGLHPHQTADPRANDSVFFYRTK